MLKDKGIILVEVLWSIFIFSLILVSLVPSLQILIKEKGHRNEEYKALMIARTEMEISQIQLENKNYEQNPYDIEVKVEPYRTSIVEIQVIVKWKEETDQPKQIVLKKLVFSNT